MAQNNRANLGRIVICLFRFDLWSAEAIIEGLNEKQRLENIEHHFRYMWESPPPPKVLDGWLQSPELYHSQPLPALREYLDAKSERQLFTAIMNSSTKTFYTRLMLKRISKVLEQKAIHNYATQHLERAFEESQGLLIMQRPVSRGEYLVRLVHGLTESRVRLRAVIREARLFRDNIGEAFRAEGLNASALELLRGKLEALNEYYDEAYQELRGEEVPEMLMDSRRTQFWYTPLHELTKPALLISTPADAPYRDPHPHTPPPTPPAHAVDAYPLTSQLNFLPTLTILILAFSFVASILAYLCFSSTPPGHGSPTDAGFYQLLSGFVLQLLGIVTLLWPTVFHARLSGMAWFWTWVLAGTAAICAVLSILLYLGVSVGWSGLLAFLGQASMGAVSLMLIFRV
jgi:hypothetical protein